LLTFGINGFIAKPLKKDYVVPDGFIF